MLVEFPIVVDAVRCAVTVPKIAEPGLDDMTAVIAVDS
jgi:hypothetical protein